MTGGVYVVPALGVQLPGPRPDLGDLNDHPVNGPAAWKATVQSMRRAAQFTARVRQDVEAQRQEQAMRESDTKKLARLEAYLHSRFAHPDFEYEETRGPRKSWDSSSDPPEIDERGGWVRNVHRSEGWERFEYHEEAYWMRPKGQP